jgi:hypothetical protein
MGVHEYAARFYRLSVDGLEGSATAAGIKIMNAGLIPYGNETWAIANQIVPPFEPKVTAALLTRSRRAQLVGITSSEKGVFLAPESRETNDFVPIVFYHTAHVFVVPETQRFRSSKVIGALKRAASQVLAKVTILPFLREDSILERLRSYAKVTQLSVSLVRANPESPDDAKLLTDDFENSHVQQALLRLTADPRGLNLDGRLVRQPLAYVEDGYGEIRGGKAINHAGNEERISGSKAAPLTLSIESMDEPTDFAKKLNEREALTGSRGEGALHFEQEG